MNPPDYTTVFLYFYSCRDTLSRLNSLYTSLLETMGGGGGMGVTSAWSPVSAGQLHRRPNTPKRFCLSAIFIEPGFIYFLCCEVSFSCVFCVCFPVVQGFLPRLLCLFSNSFQFKLFIYSLYIHIYIFLYTFFSLYSGFFDLCWVISLGCRSRIDRPAHTLYRIV